MLPSEIPKLPTDPTCEKVSYCVETFPPSRKGGGKRGGKPSPGWVSVLKSFVSLLVFIFCPPSFWRDWFAFLGISGPPPAFRSCSVEVAPHADDLSMYLWGRKWSPHPIPPPSWDHLPLPLHFTLKHQIFLKKLLYLFSFALIRLYNLYSIPEITDLLGFTSF